MRLRSLTNTDFKLNRNTFTVSSTAPIINFANLSNSALLGTAFVSRSAVKEANANCVMGHRRQFLAELVVATIVADGAEGKTCCSVSHCAVRLSDPSQLA